VHGLNRQVGRFSTPQQPLASKAQRLLKRLASGSSSAMLSLWSISNTTERAAPPGGSFGDQMGRAASKTSAMSAMARKPLAVMICALAKPTLMLSPNGKR